LDRPHTPIALLGTILIGLIAPACQAKGKASAEAVPGLRLERVTFRIYRDSSLRASGRAARVDYRRDADEVVAQDLGAVLPRPEGDVRVQGAHVQGHVRGRQLQAEGGLEVARADVTARTERARYDGGPPESVRGDDPVHVQGASWQLDGTGFTVDPATGDLQLGSGGGGTRLVAQGARLP